MKQYILTCSAILLLTACTKASGPYEYPGYYQPSQAQAPYSQVGYQDDMGNYHPPTAREGDVLFGRWYRPQPENAGPSLQEMYEQRNPYYSYEDDVSRMSADGDVGTAL